MDGRGGILVAVEGIDGAGKSTQIPNIADWFRARGYDVVTTAEPTKGAYGRLIRGAAQRLSPPYERELFVKDRREHLENCILPALCARQVVVSDRYFYSSVAYQGTRRDAFGGAPSAADLAALERAVEAENRAFAPEADVLIYMRLPVDTALERMKMGRESLDPFEARQTLIDVAAAFERIVRRHPCAIAVDASRDAAHVREEIFRGLENVMARHVLEAK